MSSPSHLTQHEDASLTAMTASVPNRDHTSAAKIEAREYGIDLSLLDYNLTLTHDQRIEQHEAALELVRELVIAREALRAKP